jgi:hypothetical protein
MHTNKSKSTMQPKSQSSQIENVVVPPNDLVAYYYHLALRFVSECKVIKTILKPPFKLQVSLLRHY